MRPRQLRLLTSAASLAMGLLLAPAHTGAQEKPLRAWAPKSATPAPYVAPNKPIWKLAEIQKQHAGQKSWTQPIVRTRDFAGDYISMGPGEKTKTVFYAD